MKIQPTRVVNIKTEAYDVYIGRPGKGLAGPFGNPHVVEEPCKECLGLVHKRGEAIYYFRQYFHERLKKDFSFRTKVLALKGLRLGCFCSPKPCHGDVIAHWVDSQTP